MEVSGDINVADNSKFVAGGTHAIISGNIMGSGKTLTLANFTSAATYAMEGGADKSINLGGMSISGDTVVNMNYASVTIGTLTLNSSSTSAALTLTGSGTTTITSLVTSNVLDASSMTGTLNISGAKWTGNLSTDTEDVLIAKDDTTASSLATSMNTSHGISYVFRAEGNVVKRDLRTETYTLDAFINNGRIVAVSDNDKKTFGDKEFSKVGLSDLRTNDTVTIDGLTGWIGDASSNNIWADLVFKNTTSINNGSSTAGQNIIYYHGAISGDGTLSFDWTGKTNNYVFNGDLSGFTGMIKDEATLNVTIGGTLAEGVSNAVNATIDIAGALTVNRDASFSKAITVGGALNVNSQATFGKAVTVGGALTLEQGADFSGTVTVGGTLTVKADSSITNGTITGNVNLKSGVLTVTGNLALSNELDMKGGDGTGGPCSGYAKVAQNATLSVTDDIWGWSASAKVLLEEGGNLEWKPGTVTITGKAAKDGVDTGLKFGEDGALALNNANHTVTNSVITYTGTNEKTLSWELVDTDLNVESGTVNLANNSIGGNLTINAGTVKTSANSNIGVVGAHTITINAGGTLVATGVDAFGWKDGQKCTKITMQGGQDSIAKVSLNNTDSRWQTTFGTDVLLKGYATIDGTSAFKTAGGKIEATGTNNVISAAMCVKDDVEVNVTGATDTLQIDNIQYFHDTDANTDSSGTVSVTGKGTLNVGAVTRSALKNTGSGSVEITGAVSDSTISNTGSGSVTLRGTTDSATKLISSGSNGSLTAQGVSSLAEVKAENGGSITLRMAAADDLTAVSLTDLVIGNGSSVSVQVSDGTDGGTASVDNITVGQGTTLGANLTLGEGAGMSFNVAGLAGADGEAAICTLTGSLTLGLNVELHLLNLGMLGEGKSITLFTGVTGFTYSGATSVATLSDDDISTGIDASQIFGNVDSGFFTVKYDGNNVILTASSNVPEPTTATLSLLALMGLAARRRRRKA